jgi:hypothetical protein
MIVFYDYTKAYSALRELSNSEKSDMYLTYGPYGINPRRIEFALRFPDEVIDEASPYIMAIKRRYSDEIDERISLEELQKRLPDYEPFILNERKCGDLRKVGLNCSVVDSLPLRIREY